MLSAQLWIQIPAKLGAGGASHNNDGQKWQKPTHWPRIEYSIVRQPILIQFSGQAGIIHTRHCPKPLSSSPSSWWASYIITIHYLQHHFPSNILPAFRGSKKRQQLGSPPLPSSSPPSKSLFLVGNVDDIVIVSCCWSSRVQLISITVGWVLDCASRQFNCHQLSSISLIVIRCHRLTPIAVNYLKNMRMRSTYLLIYSNCHFRTICNLWELPPLD